MSVTRLKQAVFQLPCVRCSRLALARLGACARLLEILDKTMFLFLRLSNFTLDARSTHMYLRRTPALGSLSSRVSALAAPTATPHTPHQTPRDRERPRAPAPRGAVSHTHTNLCTKHECVRERPAERQPPRPPSSTTGPTPRRPPLVWRAANCASGSRLLALLACRPARARGSGRRPRRRRLRWRCVQSSPPRRASA